MKKLIIKQIDKTIYKLVDNHNNEYQLNLEFIGINESLKENDIIFISMELLNPYSDSYNSFYTFGLFSEKSGRNNIKDIDIIKIMTNKKEIYLKRLYG